jgi:acetyltransferase-like isoleucine patch superfamily enzyme
VSRVRTKRGPLATAAELLCWLLPPSKLKNRLLRMWGHDVAETARVLPSIVVGVGHFHLGEHVRTGLLNVFHGLGTAWFDDCAIVESWNWISAHPIYQELDPDAGTLFLGVRAKIGSRNYLDCSGTIVVRTFGTVGGQRCILYTHEPDFEEDRQVAGRICVGAHSFIGSGAVLLKGATLPDRSQLAANSTLTHTSASDGRPGLYAGAPAVWKRDAKGKWFDRTAYMINDHVIESPMGVGEDDRGDPDKPQVTGVI